MAETYYPPLSSIVAVEDLPPQLDFLQNGLKTIFSSIFFRALQYSTNARGDEGFFSLVLIVYERLGFEIPELGLGLYLNPSTQDYSTGDHLSEFISEIPLTVNYSWGVLRFVDGFDLESFKDDAEGLYNLAVQKMSIDPVKLVEEAVNNFVTVTTNKVQKLVQDIQTAYNTTLTLTVPSTGTIAEQITAIVPFIEDQLNKPILEVIYKTYLEAGGAIEKAIKERINSLFGPLLEGKSVMEYLADLLIPKIEATVGLGIELDFPPAILKPVNGIGKSRIKLLGGKFYFNTNGKITYENPTAVHFKESYIGNTGLRLKIDGAKLDLSRTENIPEIAGDGRTPDFVGVYVKQAIITLPDSWFDGDKDLPPGDAGRAKIVGDGLIIGTGGISGTITLRASTAPGGRSTIKFMIGDPDTGFLVEFLLFSLTFRQNSIVGSNIKGKLTIPALSSTSTPKVVDIDVAWTDNKFAITASTPGGVTLHIGDPGSPILTIKLNQVSIGSESGRFFIGTSGTIEVGTLPVIGKFIEKPIEVKKLVIWSDGEIDIEGGTIVLPKAVKLAVGPVELSVSAIHIGSQQQMYNGKERRYKYIGFDGGVKAGAAGIDARGEGIKFFFTVDDHDDPNPANDKPHHSYLRIETIRVDLTIPGDARPSEAAVLLKGFLSMKNTPPGSPSPAAQEYVGSISVSLPKLGVAGGAAMRLIPSTGAYLVDIGLELSTPILLGATGLGIYGFRGLLGNNYVANRNGEEEWWNYYTRPKRGINIEKLAYRDGFSVGAGISLATAGDSGRVFSSKLFFMLSIPEFFMLEGQAAILSTRLGLDTTNDPPFSVAIFISDKGVQAGIDVDYLIPEGSGDIVEVHGGAELAFFYGKSWYINIGRDMPESDRINAVVLKLVKMYYYLMISSAGVKMGAGASWKFQKDFSIARIGIGAGIDMGAMISFKPLQIGGFIKLWGYAEFRVFGFGIRVDISAGLAAEAPNPFIITGQFHISVGLPWPLPDIDVSCSLTWRFNDQLNLSEAKMLAPVETPGGTYASADDYRKDLRQPAKALHMVTQEPFMLNYLNRADTNAGAIPAYNSSEWIGSFDDFIIPLDSFIDIEFLKSVTADTAIKTIAPITTQHSWKEYIPPQKGHSPQVRHEYIVKDVIIQYWNDVLNQWLDYDQADLNTPLLEVVKEKAVLSDLDAHNLIRNHGWLGFWQMTNAGNYTKLRVLGRTPLEHAAEVSGTDLGFPTTSFLCPPERLKKICENWLATATNYSFAANQVVTHGRIKFRTDPNFGTVREFPNIFRIGKSLMLYAGNRIEIFFNEPTTEVRLKLTTFASNATISYYRGYAWAPPVEEQENPGGTSSNDDTWDAVPSDGESVGEAFSYWDKLMLTPRLKRIPCYQTSVLILNYGPGRTIKSLLERFALNNYYLRQVANLPAAVEVETEIGNAEQFCIRLTETLETLLVILTGATDAPPVFVPNIEHFYQEIAAYMDEYLSVNTLDVVPNSVANEFYEKWMRLVTCLGKLYETRWSLPQHIQTMMARVLEPEIYRLYKRAEEQGGPSKLNLNLNFRGGQSDPYWQLRSIGGFFGVLSLDFDKIVTANAETLFAPYFNRLQKKYFRIVQALKSADMKTTDRKICDMPNCSRTTEIISIMRTLCVIAPANTSTAPGKITTLVTGFEPTILKLMEHFGWTDAGVSGFCPVLRRALGMLLMAFAGYDELPFALRYKVDEFYTALQKLVKQFKEDTRNLTPVTLDPATATADEFVVEANDIFTCLCKFCLMEDEVPNMKDIRDFMKDHMDTDLEKSSRTIRTLMYTNLTTTPSVRRPAYGNSMPADSCDRVTWLINFFSAFFTECNNDSALLLESYFTAFNTKYQLLNTYLTNNNYRHCSGVQTTSCSNWFMYAQLDCIRLLRMRRWELPEAIEGKLDTDFQSAINYLYAAVFPTPTEQPGVDQDQMVWKIEQIIAEFRRLCLTGQEINPALVDYMDGLFFGMIDLMALPGYPDINGCASDSCDRPSQLINFYKVLCMESSVPKPTPPAAIITAVQGLQNTLNEITTAIGLKAVDVSSVSLDFYGAFNKVIRVLVIAYSALDELSLRTIAAMNAFCNTVQQNLPASRPVVPGSCPDTCTKWLNMLYCLCRICRHRGLFPALDAEFETQMADQLKQLCSRVEIIAAHHELEFAPGRRVENRCHYMRTVGKYIATQSLDYAQVPGVMTLLYLYDDIARNFNEKDLDTLRETVCFPEPGPYDPLMKRETITQLNLMRAIYYDDPAKPIDRIVIEPGPCNTSPPGTWLNDYWNMLRISGINEVLFALGNDLTAMQALRDAQVLDSNEWTKYDERMDEIVQAQADANAFKTDLNTALPSGSYPPCSTFIHEVCWMPPAVFDYNAGLPPARFAKEVAMDLSQSMKYMNQPIWRPNTRYAIRIKTEERINGDAKTRYRTWGFKTAGPVGHFHEFGNNNPPTYHPVYNALQAADRDDEFKYKSLAPYIDYERSYPNADGNLVDAKPLYYDKTKLQIFYRYSYIQSMYSGWGWWNPAAQTNPKFIYSALELLITDAAEARTGTPIKIITTWRKDSKPRMPKALKAFRNVVRNTQIAGQQCLAFDPVEEVPTKSMAIPLRNLDLLPRKLYTVSFTAAFKELAYDTRLQALQPADDLSAARREVHKYVFRTSRYADFAQHIESYKLSVSPEKKAFYAIEITDSTAFSTAQQIVADPNVASTALKIGYAHVFERIMEGVLGLKNMLPAENVEFHIIRKPLLGTVLGILVRSPEPFNDPKLPLAELEKTITVAALGSGTKLIFSKDRTQVLITTTTGLITQNSLDILFYLWEYNGSAYAQARELELQPDGVSFNDPVIAPVTVTLPIPR